MQIRRQKLNLKRTNAEQNKLQEPKKWEKIEQTKPRAEDQEHGERSPASWGGGVGPRWPWEQKRGAQSAWAKVLDLLLAREQLEMWLSLRLALVLCPGVKLKLLTKLITVFLY